jgi:hypothetical protein
MTQLVAPCRDCRIETLPIDWGYRAEFYMVHDEVWTQAGMGEGDEYLCVACLERRLGRQLLPVDFIPGVPVNNPHKRPGRYAWTWRTKRLRDRLLGQLSLFEVEP